VGGLFSGSQLTVTAAIGKILQTRKNQNQNYTEVGKSAVKGTPNGFHQKASQTDRRKD
jgi:hypothetical protein